MKKYFLLAFIITTSTILGQKKAHYYSILDTVLLQSNFNKTSLHTYTHKVLEQKNLKAASLENALHRHSDIFIKSYGRGMVSSISLRGMGASHTQVLWNGIPINSKLNGQTDLNSIYTSGFDQLIIKKGGSSTIYGSGASGGVILLNNLERFKKDFSLNNRLSVGSFQTINNSVTLGISSQKIYSNFNFQANQSKNNYPIALYNRQNRNGEYSGINFSGNLAYRIDKSNHVYFKSQQSFIDRNLSSTLFGVSSDRLTTLDNRYLLGWKLRKKNWESQSDLALIRENFSYYFNKNSNRHTRNQSQTWLLKNKWSLWHKKHQLYIGNEFGFTRGIGDGIGNHQRKSYTFFVVWAQQIHRFTYHANLRKEFVNAYAAPVIGALETAFQLNNNIALRANVSNNYRLPTFNDLYWTMGGNPNLKPEKSLSFELGQDFVFKKLKMYLTGFYIQSTDMIRWTPQNSLFWSPKNIDRVNSKGIELQLEQKIILTDKLSANISLNATYQQTQDQNNIQIIYTPQRLLWTQAKVSYHHFSLQYMAHYTGKIYTTTSHSQFIDPYFIQDIRFQYHPNNKIEVESVVKNITNTYYQTIPDRPLPGRNYQLNINYKIN